MAIGDWRLAIGANLQLNHQSQFQNPRSPIINQNRHSSIQSTICNPQLDRICNLQSAMNYRQNLVAVTAASFIGFMGFTLVMPFLPLYFHQLGVTDVGEVATWSGLSLG